MSVTISPSVVLETNRCSTCGRWWAIEAGWSADCPRCAWRKRADRETAVAGLQRSIRSLRGALTKARKVTP